MPKRWFKPSIETETERVTSSKSPYGKIVLTACIGSVCFFAMGNYDIQRKMSNIVNAQCLDYLEVKESYECYLNRDLSAFPRAEPSKRLIAVIVDSIVVGFVVGVIALPMMVRVGMVVMTAKYFNQQSPGFMLMGLRGVYIENKDNKDRFENDTAARTQWRARMDYTSFIRRQFAFHPIELCIYIACLGSMGTASILSALAFGSHLAQFYASSNRTWLDKWSKIQVIDLAQLQNKNNEE